LGENTLYAAFSAVLRLAISVLTLRNEAPRSRSGRLPPVTQATWVRPPSPKTWKAAQAERLFMQVAQDVARLHQPPESGERFGDTVAGATGGQSLQHDMGGRGSGFQRRCDAGELIPLLGDRDHIALPRTGPRGTQESGCCGCAKGVGPPGP